MILQNIIDALQPVEFVGSPATVVNEIIPLDKENVRDDVIFWISGKNSGIVREIKSGTIICKPVESSTLNPNCNYIFVENPRSAFRRLLGLFAPAEKKPLISASAKISPDAVIGENVFIGENVVIEEGCTIGDFSVINHNAVLFAGTNVGQNVKIGSCTTVGSVGFGYEKDEITGKYEILPHLGNVIIEDLVEIGQCTTIDRAVLGSTIIRKNAKIDNLVHIAHGVEIGENSLIIANAMIAGSTKIGSDCWVSPSASILNKIEIGNNSLIGMGAVVLKSVEPGQTVVGNPAKSIR